MKKSLVFFLTFYLSLMLCSCSINISANSNKEYINQIENVFNNIISIDNEIKNINPENDEALSSLIVACENLSKEYDALSQIEAPLEYKKTQELAKEASEYMLQASEYFSESFSETQTNEAKLENGMECYKRACKRLNFIIKILHNESVTE